MSPRLDPRLYVIRLSWLGRRFAYLTLPVNPRPARDRAAKGRWPRPSGWRPRP